MPHALVRHLAAEGITEPFPIQSATLPDSLAGRDVLGRGRTGSGKTLAFLLPLLTRLAGSSTRTAPRRPRGLILVPTRELASQIDAAMRPLAGVLGLRSVTVFGGVPAGRQIQALARGVDVVVACPGRLQDLKDSGHVDLSGVEVTVLDEADHMADLGFLPVVRRLLDATPRRGQRLLFSATLDAGVDVLSKRYLTQPVVHSVDEAQAPVTSMTHHVLHVAADARIDVVADLSAAPGRTVVFTRTKSRAKSLTRQLRARGVSAVELHGDLAQNARTRNLAAFSGGEATTLVATDIAARGIHVDEVALVVHADPPVEHKAYVHRSGRTARAGESGTVVTVMLDDQVAAVRDLTRRAGVRPTTTRVHPGHPLLHSIAPGERRLSAPLPPARTEPAGRPVGRSAGQPAGPSRDGSRSRPRGGAGGAQRRQGPSTSARSGRDRRPATVTTSSSHNAASFSAGIRGR